MTRVSLRTSIVLLFTAFLPSATGALFISEYVEGSSTNKAVELFNPGSQSVNLSAAGYQLIRIYNGGVWGENTFLSLSGTVSPHSTFTVCHGNFSPLVPGGMGCDATWSSLSSITGDDALALGMNCADEPVADDSCLIDTIGTAGADPGSGWTVSGVPNATKDHTLVRRGGIAAGSGADWAASSESQWLIFPKNTIKFLGSHSMSTAVADCAAAYCSGHGICAAHGGDPGCACYGGYTNSSTMVSAGGPEPCVTAPPINDPGSECPWTTGPPGSAKADRRSAANASLTTLTVATWNVEFLFDGINPESSLSPFKDSSSSGGLNPMAATAHINEVAEVLRVVNADVVNLLEVEDCSVVQTLVGLLNTPSPAPGGGGYRGYLRQGTDYSTGQDAALLTRLDPQEDLSRTSLTAAFPVAGSDCHFHDTGSQGVSKHYMTRIKVADFAKDIVLIGAHFRAFPTEPEACARREAQAMVIRQLVQQALSDGHHVVVMGDLNDFDPDVKVADGVANSPTSNVLRLLRDVDASVPGDELFNVAGANENAPSSSSSPLVPINERYTAWHDSNGDGADTGLPSERGLIDHVLVSRCLRWAVTAVTIPRSFSPVSGASDHFPVKLAIDLETAAQCERGEIKCPLGCNAAGDGGSCVSGVCECNVGFTGPDCASRIICPEDCNYAAGRGICVLGRACECMPGWTGAGCHLRSELDIGDNDGSGDNSDDGAGDDRDVYVAVVLVSVLGFFIGFVCGRCSKGAAAPQRSPRSSISSASMDERRNVASEEAVIELAAVHGSRSMRKYSTGPYE